MEKIRQSVAVIAGILLASGGFLFADSDRWNAGRIIVGMGMSVAAVRSLIGQPKRMTRFVIVIVFLPLLAILVIQEAQKPTADWMIALLWSLLWSLLLLGTLFFHAFLSGRESEDAGIRISGQPDPYE